jgi:4-amino-4-deoxy-L-arabinose transferase-like glycosyltransferase
LTVKKQDYIVGAMSLGYAAAEAGAARPASRLAIWRAPRDQPAWARPVLLVITAVSAFSYAWRASAPVNIEIYYAAAVRSMSMSWHDFVFGAFDPAGTITTDKLPGAFWVQALSLRLFGVHTWALVLPQVIAGALTIGVLYHAVRRLAGPAAGMLAAAILAISPATVSLNRGNVPDTLMILLVVLAADAVVTALVTGRLRPVLLAGVWVGLAFQAKMIEAWLVLPALAGCYLLAGAGDLRQRVRRAVAMGLVAVAVSLAWMTVVTVWPASLRPYADGSQDNSVFAQVFVYNGFGRLDQTSPDQLLDRSIGLGLPKSPPPGWDRLLTGSLGRDTGWLLVAALVVLAAGLAARRGRPRDDLIRASLVLWGTWLIVVAAVFSASSAINSYYTAALSPAVAGLLATGLALAWQHRERVWSWLAVGAALLSTAGYALWLLPSGGTGLPSWLRPALTGLALAAACAVAAATWRRPASRMLAAGSITLATLAVLAVPAVASASVVSSGLGPFETPFEPQQATAGATAFFGAPFSVAGTLPALEAGNRGAPYLMATQTSALAAPFIWASGREVLPVGGFTGTIPEPSLAALKNMIEIGDVHTFLQSPTATDPRLAWVARNCLTVTKRPGSAPVLPIGVYYCGPFVFLKSLG